jgi:hypothetical protein
VLGAHAPRSAVAGAAPTDATKIMLSTMERIRMMELKRRISSSCLI